MPWEAQNCWKLESINGYSASIDFNGAISLCLSAFPPFPPHRSININIENKKK